MTAPRPLSSLIRLATGSVRRKLVVGIALVHAVLMTLFVFDLSIRQKDFMQGQQRERTEELARMVALNSRSWVLADDVQGLGEVVASLRDHPHMRYAMVIDQSGRVLAHTDRAKVGMYVRDEISRALLAGPRETRHLPVGDLALDVAEPIASGGR
ncbi:MAG TPA: diguanylate cyclase, partial [Candidatus Omnitrophota bacterium]|nr:diguanylate cyclase [Candidatus Omnitrophota bacterium]